MKKIGILTYFWADNPGTFLQAYATQEAFRKRLPGARVELVNYKHRHVFFKPGWRHINPRCLYLDLRRYRIYEKTKRDNFILSPRSLISRDSDEIIRFINSLGYDMLVAGADTILQLLDYHRRDGSVPIYWLPPELKGIRLMCGSSCRAMTIADLTRAQQEKMRECINTMPLIGVRDQATYDLILSLGLDDLSKLTQIPDPTFSLDIDYSHAESFMKRKKLDLSRPCILMSLPEGFSPAERLAAYFKSQGFSIAVFGHKAYADIHLPDISPFEWAGLYKYFAFVLTDRFHGTLFSIRNQTPVVSIVCSKDLMTETGKSKYASLWELFGLEKTNWINGVGCTDTDAVLEKITNGLNAFKCVSFQEKLDELKNEYVGFVDRIISLLK